MTDTPPEPVQLQYATSYSPWPRRAATASACMPVLYLLAVAMMCASRLHPWAVGVVFAATPFMALALAVFARARSPRADAETRRKADVAIALASVQIVLVLLAAIALLRDFVR